MAGLIKDSIAELEALVSDTERCAEKILEAAENIQASIDDINDPLITEKIQENLSAIFEATHFQDFSGQRSTNITNNLKELESKVGDVEADEKSFEDNLKSGPQLVAANQEDIDKMFD